MQLSDLQDFDDVAARLGVTTDLLESLIENRGELYERHSYKKQRRSGIRERVVYEAPDRLRDRQRKIALWVQDSWLPLDCVHGFRKARSTFTNARQHLGRPAVVVADVHDFFHSITEARVRDAFSRLGANPEIADTLTALTTLDGFLPAGTRSSPIIANVVMEPVDRRLLSLHPTYTRYADDLTFSGERSDLPEASAIAAVLADFELRLRPGSFREYVAPATQWVTGLVVNHSWGPHYPKRVKKRMRLQVHFIKKFGLSEHCERTGEDEARAIKRILGTLMHMRSVEPEVADPLLKQLLPEYPLSMLRFIGVQMRPMMAEEPAPLPTLGLASCGM